MRFLLIFLTLNITSSTFLSDSLVEVCLSHNITLPPTGRILKNLCTVVGEHFKIPPGRVGAGQTPRVDLDLDLT